MYLRWHHFRRQKHVSHLHSLLLAKKKDILVEPRELSSGEQRGPVKAIGAERGIERDCGDHMH